MRWHDHGPRSPASLSDAELINRVRAWVGERDRVHGAALVRLDALIGADLDEIRARELRAARRWGPLMR